MNFLGRRTEAVTGLIPQCPFRYSAAASGTIKPTGTVITATQTPDEPQSA